MTKQPNASVKSKELQPTAQSQRFATHLFFYQSHPSSPTILQVDSWTNRQKRTEQRH